MPIIFSLWSGRKIKWCDGKRSGGERGNRTYPDVPMYVVFSLGTNKEPLEKQLPARMEIDWFRGYRLKS